MSGTDRDSVLGWPEPLEGKVDSDLKHCELQDAIARGVIKGGLWLLCIVGGIAVVLFCASLAIDAFRPAY